MSPVTLDTAVTADENPESGSVAPTDLPQPAGTGAVTPDDRAAERDAVKAQREQERLAEQAARDTEKAAAAAQRDVDHAAAAAQRDADKHGKSK